MLSKIKQKQLSFNHWAHLSDVQLFQRQNNLCGEKRTFPFLMGRHCNVLVMRDHSATEMKMDDVQCYVECFERK